MERYEPSTEDLSRQKASRRSNLFYVGVIVVLLVLLVVIGAIFFVLFTNLPLKISPPFQPANTLTPRSTTFFNGTPTITFTPTPSATHTNTPTATPSVTPLPSFTPTNQPSPTPKPTKPPQPEVIKYSSYRIAYQDWIGVQRKKAYKNGLRCSETQGQAISYTTPVNAQKLGILFFKGPNQGKARVIIDGKVRETINLYKKSRQFQFERTYTGLSEKKHSIKVIVVGKKNARSDGYWVCVDGFTYNNTRVNDAYKSVTYGPWKIQTYANNPTYRVASLKGASFSFKINGNTFKWVAAARPDGGLAEIYVDNRFIKTVDLYSSTPQWRKRIKIDDLGDKEHKVTIIVLGQKTPGSNGTKIYLHRILYY
jgi:hypothetical protein